MENATTPAADRAEDLDADHLLDAGAPSPQTMTLTVIHCDRFGNEVDRGPVVIDVHRTERGLVGELRLTHMARMA